MEKSLFSEAENMEKSIFSEAENMEKSLFSEPRIQDAAFVRARLSEWASPKTKNWRLRRAKAQGGWALIIAS